MSILSITTISILPGLAQDRDYLWKKVQECTRNQKEKKDPSPCKEVNLTKNYAIVYDHASEFLLIPTVKITGIEDPKIWNYKNNPYYPYFWYFAWNETRNYIPNKTAEQLGLAVNSKYSRGQDQLHIHMSCINKKVSDKLNELAKVQKITTKWPDINTPNFENPNHTNDKYRVKILSDFGSQVNPFTLVKDYVGSKYSIDEQSIALARRNQKEFYILNSDSHTSNNKGHAEYLLDENCSTQ
ncbi:CDP-diacylglycerol diphosphatase [Nostoc sp. PA-18-2419]|uniref:CDP-diacylglycerol diphosphatase n=1 Tax=Nostoc sp. PA-18-2419 TaxID=2575443 RepID=UPI0016730E94|nr:CDP-diacylglycerol diphosphatase [Nostoc sp. PA-18-2419]